MPARAAACRPARPPRGAGRAVPDGSAPERQQRLRDGPRPPGSSGSTSDRAAARHCSRRSSGSSSPSRRDGRTSRSIGRPRCARRPAPPAGPRSASRRGPTRVAVAGRHDQRPQLLVGQERLIRRRGRGGPAGIELDRRQFEPGGEPIAVAPRRVGQRARQPLGCRAQVLRLPPRSPCFMSRWCRWSRADSPRASPSIVSDGRARIAPGRNCRGPRRRDPRPRRRTTAGRSWRPGRARRRSPRGSGR